MRFFVMMAAIAVSVAGFAADGGKGAPLFKAGPSDSELKAKNEAGHNWEGPHVAEIKTFSDWDKALTASKGEPVFVFKHSTTCPINARAAYRVNKWLDAQGDDAPKMVFVKVIEKKPISQKIAARVEVVHESPQMLLIVDGKSVWDSDHEEITGKSLSAAVAAHVGDGE